MEYKYRTFVISDIHLGMHECLHKELVQFLKKYLDAEYLILNGDIVDGYQFKKKVFWKNKQNKILKRLFNQTIKKETKIHYIIGNHDDFLMPFNNMNLSNITISKILIFDGIKGKYLITHGDIFDKHIPQYLYYLGDTLYTGLLYINKIINKIRNFFGYSFFSYSLYLKRKIKSINSWCNKFETRLATFAKEKNTIGVICGHIHKPEIKIIDGIQYLNSGDWVESGSVLVEHWNGEWEILYYNSEEFMKKDLDNDLDDKDF